MTAYSALWLRGARRLRHGHGALVREGPRAPQRAGSGGEEHHILPVTHSKFSWRLRGSTSYSHKFISRKTRNERPVPRRDSPPIQHRAVSALCYASQFAAHHVLCDARRPRGGGGWGAPRERQLASCPRWWGSPRARRHARSPEVGTHLGQRGPSGSPRCPHLGIFLKNRTKNGKITNNTTGKS